MTVVLDMRWIFTDLSGIGAYTRELARRLPCLDASIQYHFLFDHPELERRERRILALDNQPNVHTHVVPYGPFSPVNQWRLAAWLRQHEADIFHSTNYMIPLPAFPRSRRGRTACVTTIHDVIPLILRDHAPRSRKARLFPLYRGLMKEIGRRTDRIITVSAVSRRDVLEQLAIPREKADRVVTIHNGVGDAWRTITREPDPDPTRERRLLYVGRFDPYKNAEGILRALPRIRRACPFPVRLVLAGSPDPRYPHCRELAVKLGLEAAVTWTGYLAEDALHAVYREADMLVHLSRYEGFGLQILEAMAAGLPVVCSRAGSLPEVAGKAALLVDPDDETGFVEAVASVLTDPAVAGRLVRTGRERAAAFTWERTAWQTLAVYRALGEGST